MLPKRWTLWSALIAAACTLHGQELRHVRQRIADGVIEGVVSADGNVRTFKGIPYAAPPVGPLRWKPPQAVKPWSGVRMAIEYGARPMQGRIFDDMVFHDAGPSEDCLYLNLWIPEKAKAGKLPVMVWIYGGGFMAGATSEPRQDGGMLCQKGVIVVSMNYRLGIFGFFAHPELTQESEHHASGNYGLMDQAAALAWVHRNIAAFGGDPNNVTIFGESAGSMSVCSMMATPLTHGLFEKAIGESGGMFNASHPMTTLAEAEKEDVAFVKERLGTSSLAELRAMPADKLLAATMQEPRRWFGPNTDGYVFPEDGLKIYSSGQQAHVPLLAGWNLDEGSASAYFGDKPQTLENFRAIAHEKFGDHADEFLKVYHADNDAEARRAAADYAGDKFIAYSTWKWLELQQKTGGSPVYRYKFEQTLPLTADAKPGTEPIAPHASDIEYVFRVLPARHVPWTDAHRKTSELIASYWTNFAKTGNPNGAGLPQWPQYAPSTDYAVMHLKAEPEAKPATDRDRYRFLESIRQDD